MTPSAHAPAKEGSQGEPRGKFVPVGLGCSGCAGRVVGLNSVQSPSELQRLKAHWLSFVQDAPKFPQVETVSKNCQSGCRVDYRKGDERELVR